MQWVALSFPRLPLEAKLRGHASFEAADEPWAVVENRSVLVCNGAAEALGVHPGSALTAAWALAPQLRILPRAIAAEGRALEAIAAWACQFTSKVSLEPPQSVLLEVEGSLRLFGGAARLMARLRNGLADLGFKALLAAGPTARAALWLARGGGETLQALPIGALALEPQALALLGRIGVGTLGELMRLPRAGIAARFGEGLLRDLDRALGRSPEPRIFFQPPERFDMQLELPAPAIEAERVLFAARRLLLQLEGFLAARQAGVRGFTLRLSHRDVRPTRIEIGSATPHRDIEHWQRLLRERLGAMALSSPAEAIRIEAAGLTPLARVSPGLFGSARSEAEAWERLTERLQARLGGAVVHGLATHAEHRPERAWRAAAGGTAMDEAPPGPRPLWLLEPPRRLGEGEFALLAGPERIESGWWDGDDVVRDYFIAARGASLAWIYRTREGWFLHGLFA
ncbi:MAG: DNA polymerase Y family protein [Betaproteobacteria bacterium]|nr:DNA polymerase Y family protein [Betaproteobacteria bacterium]MDH5210225.1 DNA polymerase Y family protein [Betaproteobacteria bacterium]MDH5578411.1 DNA polymerase Y family protein [Betaproteobacteria bacterium]